MAVNNDKVEKANLIYSKLTGIKWAQEKNEEYHDYDRCKECQKAIDELNKDLTNLKLTNEEMALTGYDQVDYEIAYEYEGRYR